MRIKTEKVYTIDELDEETQKKVLDEHRQINVRNSFWYEYLLTQFVEEAKQIGFDIDREGITFSLWNRDAHFGIRRKDVSFQHNILEGYETWASIEKGIKKFGYHFTDFPHRGWNRSEERIAIQEIIDKETGENMIGEKKIEDLEEKLRKKLWKLGKLCKKYHKKLKKEYEHCLSDEQVKETLRANDFEFYADGTEAH